MNIDHPQPPFEPGPIDWTQGVDCRFEQIAAVIEAARRKGFLPIRVQVIPFGCHIEFGQQIAQDDVCAWQAIFHHPQTKAAPAGTQSAATGILDMTGAVGDSYGKGIVKSKLLLDP